MGSYGTAVVFAKVGVGKFLLAYGIMGMLRFLEVGRGQGSGFHGRV
jgi:hypothetical protein